MALSQYASLNSIALRGCAIDQSDQPETVEGRGVAEIVRLWPKAAIPECLRSRRCWGLSGRRPVGSRCFYERTPSFFHHDGKLGEISEQEFRG